MVPCSPSSESWYNHPEFVLVFSHFMALVVLPLHLLGAFCILKRTPSSMSSVKWTILNLHLWNTLVDCLMNVMVIPCPLFPTVSGYLLGVFSWMGVRATVQAWLLATSLSFVCVSVDLIFENRFHLLLAKNTRWTLIRPLWMVANFTFCLSYTLPIVWQVPDQAAAKRIVLETLPCLPDYLKSMDIVVPTLDGSLFIYTTATFVIVIFGQLVGLLSVLLYQLSSHFGVNLLSKTTRRLQRNLSITLLLQTGIPFVYLLAPVAYGVLAISTQFFSLAMNNFVIVMTSLHGFVSTSSMLLIHHPYRRTVLIMLRRPVAKRQLPTLSRNNAVELTYLGL